MSESHGLVMKPGMETKRNTETKRNGKRNDDPLPDFFFFVLSSYHVSVCLPVRREHRVKRSYICSKAVKVRFSSGRQLDCSSINYIPLLSLTRCQDPAYCRLRVLCGSFVPCLLNVMMLSLRVLLSVKHLLLLA